MAKRLPIGKLPAAHLERLISYLPTTDKSLTIPPSIGCDAAGVVTDSELLAITTDPITFTTERLATYSICVNINDIACMGCTPRWFSACVLVPDTSTEAQLDDLFHSLGEELKRYNIVCIGGHTEITNSVTQPIIIGQMLGTPGSQGLLDIRQAQAGDELLLWQGAAIEGSALIAQAQQERLSKHFSDEELQCIANWIDKPGICVLPFAERLLPNPSIIGLHDPTEGGIATAIHEIADAAGCGIEVVADNLTIFPETQIICTEFAINPLGLLASGCLLIVCKAGAAEELLTRFADAPLAQIGTLTENKERVLITQNDNYPLPRFAQDEITLVL